MSSQNNITVKKKKKEKKKEKKKAKQIHMISIPYVKNRNESLFVLDFNEGRSDSPFRVRSVVLDCSKPWPSQHEKAVIRNWRNQITYTCMLSTNKTCFRLV